MPSIAIDRSAPDVRQLIREAINAALVKGYYVTTSQDRGVICVSDHGDRWAPDPRYRGRVNVVGAAILAAQPDTGDDDAAGFESLQTSVAWVEGFETGLSGQLPLASWKGSLAEGTSKDGWLVGVEFRALMGIRKVREERANVTPIDPRAGLR